MQVLQQHDSTHEMLLTELSESLSAADSVLAALPVLLVLQRLVRGHASSLDAHIHGVQVWRIQHLHQWQCLQAWAAPACYPPRLRVAAISPQILAMRITAQHEPWCAGTPCGRT